MTHLNLNHSYTIATYVCVYHKVDHTTVLCISWDRDSEGVTLLLHVVIRIKL